MGALPGWDTVRMNQQTDRKVTMQGVLLHRGPIAQGAQAYPPHMQVLDCMCDRFADLYAVAGL